MATLIPDPTRILFFTGKGGVGKTSTACATAIQLADRGRRVLLVSTDPAAHVEAAIAELGPAPTLTVTRIDPDLETRRYSEEVMATAGRDLDAQGRALLEEDLHSPCTEEIAAFRAFADTVARGEDGLVVIDTAPRGSTPLLLDSAEGPHLAELASHTPTISLIPWRIEAYSASLATHAQVSP